MNHHWELRNFVSTIPKSMFFDMIRERIADRQYQAWAASYIWWLYDLSRPDSYCALTQLAHISIDYYTLSVDKLDKQLARVGILQTPTYRDISQTATRRRPNKPTRFCLNRRAEEFIENDNLIWVDLIEEMRGRIKLLRRHARVA